MTGYALIKILEGVNQGKKRTVPISDITPEIRGIKFDPSKKYVYEKLKVRVIDSSCKYFTLLKFFSISQVLEVLAFF